MGSWAGSPCPEHRGVGLREAGDVFNSAPIHLLPGVPPGQLEMQWPEEPEQRAGEDTGALVPGDISIGSPAPRSPAFPPQPVPAAPCCERLNQSRWGNVPLA